LTVVSLRRGNRIGDIAYFDLQGKYRLITNAWDRRVSPTADFEVDSIQDLSWPECTVGESEGIVVDDVPIKKILLGGHYKLRAETTDSQDSIDSTNR
jgi:hypothetical protein